VPDIYICMGSSCFSSGNAENLRVIRNYLETHGLQAVVRPVGHLCEGLCSQGPNLIMNGTVHHEVDTAKMSALLTEYFAPKERA
jgi:NADH:ubiquinone oxidoreductase subunit E